MQNSAQKRNKPSEESRKEVADFLIRRKALCISTRCEHPCAGGDKSGRKSRGARKRKMEDVWSIG